MFIILCSLGTNTVIVLKVNIGELGEKYIDK